MPPIKCTKRNYLITGLLASLLLSACSATNHSEQLELNNTVPVSASVQYQRNSKEYPLLASYVYRQAIAALPKQFNQTSSPGVVVMDIDETVLDNSLYQEERESRGLGYTSESWNAWVKREEATLVPGVRSFLNTVIERGGKIALITNRNKPLDSHTWNNLLNLGLPLTPENTCILGRESEDKLSVDGVTFFNDKDRRRKAIKEGNAACSNIGEGSAKWHNKHTIIMQIGDNIEDFEGVTQEDADVSAILPHIGKTLFILPNPMYGSWQ